MKKLLVLLFGILAIVFQASLGNSIVSLDLFSYAGIQAQHDLLSDSAHYSVAIPAELPAGNSWAGAAGSITYDEETSTYYVSVRQRGDGVRGDKIQVWSSVDLENWSKVWEVDKNNVANRNIRSVEVTTIRKYDGLWYFYFGWEKADFDWDIDCVVSETVEGLAEQFQDASNWHRILWWNGYTKDPRVYELDGLYYMVYTDGGQSIYILRATQPDFSDRIVLTKTVMAAYKTLYPVGSDGATNIGIIYWDETSQQYIFWSKVNHGKDMYWSWMGSDDLIKWRFLDRKLIIENYRGFATTVRYFDYYAFDASHYVLIMEWDPEQDSSGDLYLWDYTQ